MESTTAARNAILHPVQIGLTNRCAQLCADGKSKVRAVNGKLGFKSGDKATRNSFGVTEHELAKAPYIFVRFTNADTGKTRREELGRFLLGVDRPVHHRNADPLDFTIANLDAAPERVKKPVKNKAAHRSALSTTASDGLNAEQQINKLAEIFPYLLQKAGAILGDPHSELEGEGITEARAPEVVANIMPGLIERVKAGKVRNVVGTALRAVEVQALKELHRKNLKLSPIKPDAGHRSFIKKLKSELPSDKPFFLAEMNGQLGAFVDHSAKKPSSFDYDSIPQH